MTGMWRQTVMDSHGSALLPVTLVLFLFSAIAVGAALVVRVELTVADRFRESAEALYAAEAALEVAVAELKACPNRRIRERLLWCRFGVRASDE